NDASVVLQLQTIAGDVLLGGDLEHFSSSRTRGWHAILDHDGRPKCTASFFKVPHHGSKNADCPEVWRDMIDTDSVCVLSPFERGKTLLPRKEDRDRVRANGGRVFITSDKRTTMVQRDSATRRMIREATRSFIPERIVMGHVQARSTGSGWTVRVSDSAVMA